MPRIVKKILIVVVVLFALGIAKDFALKIAIESAASFVVGAPARIGHFSLSLLTSRVQIKNFRLYNPPGFPQEAMVDIPLIKVAYDLPALFKGKLHLPEMNINLSKLVLIRDKEGELNVDALKVAQAPAKTEEKPKEKPQEKKSSKPMAMQLDVVTMTLGRVVVKDYSKGGKVSILAYDIGVKNKEFKDITSPEQLATLVLTRAMGPTALKSAGIYAAATVLGVGFLPAGVAGVLLSNDSAAQTFRQDYDRMYQAAWEALTALGEIIEEKKGGQKSDASRTGDIKAKVQGTDVTLSVAEKEARQVEVTIKARKLMLPRPEVAGGVLYQIDEQLR